MNVSVIDGELSNSLPILNIENLQHVNNLGKYVRDRFKSMVSFNKGKLFLCWLPLKLSNQSKILSNNKHNKTFLWFHWKWMRFATFEVALIRDICLEHDSRTIIGNKTMLGYIVQSMDV